MRNVGQRKNKKVHEAFYGAATSTHLQRWEVEENPTFLSPVLCRVGEAASAGAHTSALINVC